VTTRHTSIKAYNEIKTYGLLSKRRFEVYEWLFHNGPATGRQIVLALRKGSEAFGTYNGRLAELKKQGVALEVGATKSAETGRQAILWDVTEQLPLPLAPRKSAKEDLMRLLKSGYLILSRVPKGKSSEVDDFMERAKIVIERENNDR